MHRTEGRLEKLEATLAIQQTITRYCRALDWLDEELLRTCYSTNADIDYGFYTGPAEGFFPVVMEIERAALHRSHLLSNIAIDLDGESAEVECYGIATSTLDGKTLNVFGGRYHNSFQKVAEVWRISRSQYILDYHFETPFSDLGGAMDALQSGIGLTQEHPLYRRLHQA